MNIYHATIKAQVKTFVMILADTEHDAIEKAELQFANETNHLIESIFVELSEVPK